jgi:2-amino-4-hydroxy-6-hydroxymethyldihydropteridine diphosphokinase
LPQPILIGLGANRASRRWGAPQPILIGLGANRNSRRWGAPQQTLTAALTALAAAGVRVAARSGWYRSAPQPVSGQSWYINAVVAVETTRAPLALLAAMQTVERRFGRVCGVRNAPRVIDLDLLDYRGRQLRSPNLVLPHPRLHQRGFVLMPLAEIAPLWRHPVLGSQVRELLAALENDQPIARLIF